MSARSDIGHKVGQLGDSASEPRVNVSSDAIPYLLSTADGLAILLSSLAGGIGYQLSIGNPMPDVLPYSAVGLLASFIHVVRMSRSGFYDFPESAKPRLEVDEILVCWSTTGLLLALLAFLLKIGPDYSRGSFVWFCF